MSADTVTEPVTIRPELAHLATPIGDVTPWPGNPRQGDQDKIRDSLLTHGQYAAILVQRSTGWVVKGNNTLMVMRELGATVVAAQLLDLDDDQARKILAIDNRSSDTATYDDTALVLLLADIPDLQGTGWSPGELDDLMRATDYLGDQATAFLDNVSGSEPPAAAPPADPVQAAAAPEPAEAASSGNTGGTTVEYVTMSWTCLVPQRDIVRQAVRRAQQHAGVATAAEGLVAMAEHYLSTTTPESGAHDEST